MSYNEIGQVVGKTLGTGKAHTGYGDKSSQENTYFITESDYSKRHYDLVGYFSPVNETPDGKLDDSPPPASQPPATAAPMPAKGGANNRTSTTSKAPADNASAHFRQYGWFRQLDAHSQSLILDAYRKKNSSPAH